MLNNATQPFGAIIQCKTKKDAQFLVRAKHCLLKARPGLRTSVLAGPKIRIESFAQGSVQLIEGEPFALDTMLDANAGNSTEVGCAYQGLPGDLHAGDTLLLNDGPWEVRMSECPSSAAI